MRHVLGMARPHLDFRGAGISKAELDYLRLTYAVSQIRRTGGDAQGYFVVTSRDQHERLSRLEKDYHGQEYVEVIGASLSAYLGRTSPAETEIISGMVKAAVLEEGERRSAARVNRHLREAFLADTIQAREPGVRQSKDEARFPFRVRWDYYGIVDRAKIDPISGE
jgi:hypothetical protein